MRSALPCINLPPASSPYVIILEGVPELKRGQRESYHELRSKCMLWLGRQRQFGYKDAVEILLTRWVGNRPKDVQGDCIVINFKNPIFVQVLLGRNHYRQEGDIRSPSLGYLYFPRSSSTNQRAN